MASENMYIWNYGMKPSNDILLKPLDLMKLGRRRHLEFASANQGFCTVDGCNDLDFDAMLLGRLGNDEIPYSAGAIGTFWG